MRQFTHKGLREGTARPPELTGRNDPIKSAPTEPEAFLLWGAQRKREEGRFELSRGRVTCDMIWTSRHHTRVCSNILRELLHLVDPDQFEVGSADFAVRTPFGVRSPDVVVDRTNPRGRELSTSAPIFIAEVLSPSTAGKDFTEKLEEYTAIESLQTYLICSQDEPRAWVWVRQDDGSWPKRPVELIGREGAIALGGLGIELTMAAIFRGIPDAPTVE
ncbi:MAG: Uma2 family endonuclease [Hyphomicrobiaceae bacterium]